MQMVISDYPKPVICKNWFGMMQLLKYLNFMLILALQDTMVTGDHMVRIYIGIGAL